MPGELFSAATNVSYHQGGQSVVTNFLRPGMHFRPPYGALDLVSLSCALIFGTAGLPHILVKFYTVPDAVTARKSVVWTMGLIGSFYLMTSIIGVGASVLVGPDYIVTHGGTNMTALLLARALAGDTFLAIVSGVAFATILAVVAGLTIGASTSFAHDFWSNVIHRGADRHPGEIVLVARCRRHRRRHHCDRPRDCSRTQLECGNPRDHGHGRGRLGQFSRHRAFDFLAALQYRRRRGRNVRGIAGVGGLDSRRAVIHRNRSAGRGWRRAPFISSETLVSARKSGNCERTARLPRRHNRHDAEPRAERGKNVQRVGRARQHGLGAEKAALH